MSSEGDILLNVLALDDVSTVDRLLRLAREQSGAVFVGVVLAPAERRRLAHRIRTILPNVTAPIAGRRYWRR